MDRMQDILPPQPAMASWKIEKFRLIFHRQCGEKSLLQNKATWNGYTLFQILVEWVIISDWHLLLAGISLYSPHGSSQKVLEDSFGRIPWNLPWHTQQQDSYSCCKPSKQVWMSKRWCQQFMFALKSVPLTFVPTCISPLGKSPILPRQAIWCFWVNGL